MSFSLRINILDLKAFPEVNANLASHSRRYGHQNEQQRDRGHGCSYLRRHDHGTTFK